MLREVLYAKLHQPRVTEANLDYVGSITIDREILEYSGICENEKVKVVNINNGQRFDTYVIAGKRNSGIFCLNGAAARCVQPGDKIIVMAFAQIEMEKVKEWEPRVVYFDKNNKIIEK